MNNPKEDLKLALSNQAEGISDYLDNLGKLYVTPYGTFTSLTDIVNVIGGYHTSILRRLKSKQVKFQNWYIISGDSELYPPELCEYCDEVDDILFSEGLWYSHTEHTTYGQPLKDDSVIVYLFNGNLWAVTYQDFNNGVRPHKEKENDCKKTK